VSKRAHMLKLEDIKKDAAVNGIEAGQTARVVGVEPVGLSALTIYYKTSDGRVGERMLFRTDEMNLSLAEAGRPWAFDAPGEDFKLAAEAYRIHLAYLFDPMMAIHTSNVEPLPHQITAVYESLLPRQPLRFVLADDPGAGKTVMAGLFIREMLMRADHRGHGPGGLRLFLLQQKFAGQGPGLSSGQDRRAFSPSRGPRRPVAHRGLFRETFAQNRHHPRRGQGGGQTCCRSRDRSRDQRGVKTCPWIDGIPSGC